VNELFQGWKDFPPTNLLVRALVEGFGGIKRTDGTKAIDIPPEAQDALQQSAVMAIASKADASWLPVTRGRDPGLPKTKPTFDIDELRKRNAAATRRRIAKGQSHGD
jgi:hypothetical protein